MSILGNLIWIVFGGFIVAIEYLISGLAMCVTIIGIPFGLQAFKLGVLALLPFGQTTIVTQNGTGCLSVFMNILWLILGGLCIVFTHLAFGLIFCLTIVGIPFGLQHFKLMSLAFTPFGRTIIPTK